MSMLGNTTRKSNGSNKIKREIKIGTSPENHSPNIFETKSNKNKAYNISNVKRPTRKEFLKYKEINKNINPNNPTANNIDNLKRVKFSRYQMAKSIKDELNEFIQLYPEATYEEFIQYLHPESACIDNGIIKLDKRYYFSGSDHLRYWKNVQKKLRKERSQRP